MPRIHRTPRIAGSSSRSPVRSPRDRSAEVLAKQVSFSRTEQVHQPFCQNLSSTGMRWVGSFNDVGSGSCRFRYCPPQSSWALTDPNDRPRLGRHRQQSSPPRRPWVRSNSPDGQFARLSIGCPSVCRCPVRRVRARRRGQTPRLCSRRRPVPRAQRLQASGCLPERL